MNQKNSDKDFESRLSSILIRSLTLTKISPRNPRKKDQSESSDLFKPPQLHFPPISAGNHDACTNRKKKMRRRAPPWARLDQWTENHGRRITELSKSMRWFPRWGFRINWVQIFVFFPLLVWRNYLEFFLKVYFVRGNGMGLCRSDFTTYLWGRVWTNLPSWIWSILRNYPSLALNIYIFIFIATISAAPINMWKIQLQEIMWTMLNVTYPWVWMDL